MTIHEQLSTRPEEASRFIDRRFTSDAQTVLKASAREAIRTNNKDIRTEHLLLGIIADEKNEASKFLAERGVDPKAIKDKLELLSETGKSPVSPEELEMSPRSRRIMILASDEAKKGNKINHLDILIGIVREGEGVAAGVLESLGVGVEDLEVLRTHAASLREVILLEEQNRSRQK